MTLPSISEKNRVNVKDKIYLYHGWGYEFVTDVAGDPPFVIIYQEIESSVLKRQREFEIPADQRSDLHRAARNIILMHFMNGVQMGSG